MKISVKYCKSAWTHILDCIIYLLFSSLEEILRLRMLAKERVRKKAGLFYDSDLTVLRHKYLG